jgi:hypothetical protein
LESKVASQQHGTAARLLMPAVSKVDAASRRMQATLRCLITAVAAERYRNQHGRMAESLDQLAPEFLPAVHLDPHDGKPLRFQRRDDRLVIYSLIPGPGEAAELAAYDPDNAPRPGIGIAIHLFDVPHRRQPPAPKPQPAPANRAIGAAAKAAS